MRDIYQRAPTALLLITVVILLFYIAPWVFAAFIALLMGMILFTEWPRLFDYKKAAFWLLMPFYPIMPFVLVIVMQLTGYHALNKLTILVVALYDTASYLIGSLWGKHKINAFISPGKSWEGLIGGTLFTTILVVLYFSRYTQNEKLLPLVFLTIGMCFFALLGDLFESMLKRRAGVKDSGTILPGHGGLLDRVDGMIFVAVAVYYFRENLLAFLDTLS